MPLPKPRHAALPLRRAFHTSLPLRSRPPNHYETLSIPPSATAAEIKSQFYTLSKLHHPDLHPADPTATARFAALSTAYTALSDPHSRAAHDAALGLSPRRSPSSFSASYYRRTPAPAQPTSARPPSGPSARRRAFFAGRPPSYAAASPYPHQRHRPRQHQHNQQYARAEAPHADDPRTQDPTIPHWDRAAHFRTHEGIRLRAEAAAAAQAVSSEGGGGGGARSRDRDRDALYSQDPPADFALRFLAVAGVVVAGAAGAALLLPTRRDERRAKGRRVSGVG